MTSSAPPGDDSDACPSEDDSLLAAAAALPGDGVEGHLTPLALRLVPGAVVAGRYRLEQRLGQGGMGVVWAARHLVTLREVALKFLKEPPSGSAELRARFIREARVATQIDHPAVVPVLDVLDVDGTAILVMERLQGETLRDRLARERTLSVATVREIFAPVLSALEVAHGLGIVHRDLKPENLFLVSAAARGASTRVLDFGVAKILESASEPGALATRTGAALGTVCYMAPEQASGHREVDARADVWALGVILYECLSGRRPYPGPGLAQLLRQLDEGARPLSAVRSELPSSITALVAAMLQKDRARRPARVADVARSLAGDSPHGSLGKTRIGIVAAVLLALVVLVAFGVRHGAGQASRAPDPRPPAEAVTVAREATPSPPGSAPPQAPREVAAAPRVSRPVAPSAPAVAAPSPTGSSHPGPGAARQRGLATEVPF